MAGNRRESDRGEGQVHYHYNREERLAGKAERDVETGGIFRRNRSLAIILLDVSLVLIMFLLYLFIFRPQPSVTSIGDFNIEGSAFAFDDGVYITITTSLAEGDREPRAGDSTLIRIEWPDGTTTTDALPVDPEYPTVTRAVMTLVAGEPDESVGEQRVGVVIDDVREELILRVE